jgi:NADH:ubiquinone oxidoreductase subunit B-like Fe-S oxidoreductase
MVGNFATKTSGNNHMRVIDINFRNEATRWAHTIIIKCCSYDLRNEMWAAMDRSRLGRTFELIDRMRAWPAFLKLIR